MSSFQRTYVEMGQDDYRRVCTCLYGDDKTSVMKNDSGEERCDYYDGKVLGGKGSEYVQRGHEKREEKSPKAVKPTKLYEPYSG